MSPSTCARCTHIRHNGRPCKAGALPGSLFCVFHDPETAETVAAGRRKGGVTSRRPSRRQRAALLGELLIQAFEQPDPANTDRLETIAGFARAAFTPDGRPAEMEQVRRVKRSLKRYGTGR